MNIWKNKAGKKLTGKEFISSWKEGIKKITPLQNIKVTLIGSFIILIGIIIGIITAYVYSMWWLLIILIGSIIVQGLAFLGSIQKYMVFKNIEKIIREVDANDKI